LVVPGIETLIKQGYVAPVKFNVYEPTESVVVDVTVPAAQTASTVPPLIAAPVAAVPVKLIVGWMLFAVGLVEPPPPPQPAINMTEVITNIKIDFVNISMPQLIELQKLLNPKIHIKLPGILSRGSLSVKFRILGLCQSPHQITLATRSWLPLVRRYG
jgi:hypothetical protein